MLSQRVDDLNTQRTEKLNRVKLVEKEKDELEGPKNEAVAYIQLENQLAQYKHTLQQVGLCIEMPCSTVFNLIESDLMSFLIVELVSVS